MFRHFRNFAAQTSTGKNGAAWLSLCDIFILVLTAALAFNLGCSSGKKVGRVEKPRQESSRNQVEVQNVMNEEFDPMTLRAPEFRIPHKQMTPSADTVSMLISTPADTSWQTVPGYQVQLLQSEDAQLARETVKEAILALDTDVEIIYEAPYYKVRAGRFTNRYDAEQMQNLAVEKGYANSWVVRTQVKVRASDLLIQK